MFVDVDEEKVSPEAKSFADSVAAMASAFKKLDSLGLDVDSFFDDKNFADQTEKFAKEAFKSPSDSLYCVVRILQIME